MKLLGKRLKIRYGKEDKRELDRKERDINTQVRELLNEALETIITIRAQETTGIALGLNRQEFRKEKPISLCSPYQDWMLSFQFDDLGFFKLSCGTNELRREAMLDLSDMNSLLKILVEQPEVTRFSKATRDGMKEIGNKVNEIFERGIKIISKEPTEEKILQLIRLLVAQTEKTLNKHKAIKEGIYYLREPHDLIPFEEKIFGPLPGKKALGALEVGLER